VITIFFFLSIYKYLLQLCIYGAIKAPILIGRLAGRYIKRYRWKGLLPIFALVGLIIIGSIFRCEDSNPYDIVFKTDTFQCAQKQDTQKFEIVGKVEYVSGKLESLYSVRARTKFYSSSGELVVKSYASAVDIINNTIYRGEVAYFQINTDLSDVKDIQATEHRITECEVEYLVWPDRTPATQRNNIIEARYGKKYTIAPQPNQRYSVVEVR
jgi:hypothetical protein